MRRVHEANLVTALHFTTDLKQLLNRDSGGHLISKTLLEESLRALFNHGWQWKLSGSDNSSSCLVGGGCSCGEKGAWCLTGTDGTARDKLCELW